MINYNKEVKSMKIMPNKLYKPSEIARLGIILNTKNKPDYKYILGLIKSGQLIAVNKGLRDTPYYMISGMELIRYKKEVEGIEYEHASETQN
jgi:hypothetical protein